MTTSDGQRNCQNPAAVIGVIALTLLNISGCATRGDAIGDNDKVTRNVQALLVQHAELGPPNRIQIGRAHV